MSVNYRPARRKCLPVLAPAQAFVRAGAGRRGQFGMRNTELGRGGCARPVIRSCRGGCLRHAPGDAFLSRWYVSAYACHFRSVAAFAFDTRPVIRSCRGGCPRHAPGDAFLLRRLPFVYACPRVSVAAVAFGIRPAMRFCHGGMFRHTPVISGLLRRLPSVYVRRCVSVAAVVFGIRLSSRFCRGGCLRYTSGDAFLSLRFARGTRLLFDA